MEGKKNNERKYKNKQVYKKTHRKDSKSVTVETKTNKVQVKKIQEEALPSNWSKYEIKDSDEESGEKANFTTLLNRPISQGSHFKFKDEEDWSKDVELHSEFQKYFTLDLNLLNAGISCVKFSKRHAFNDELLKSLDEPTDKAQKIYTTYLNKLDSKKSTVVLNKSDDKIKYLEKKLSEQKLRSDNFPSEKCESYNSKINTRDDTNTNDEDIECLIHVDNEKDIKDTIDEDPLLATTVEPKIINKTTNTTEDLEQWLDDILDD